MYIFLLSFFCINFIIFRIEEPKLINKKMPMDTMLKLISVPSILRTESENMIGDKLYELITEISYFNEYLTYLNKI